jgi:hypothetical protein
MMIGEKKKNASYATDMLATGKLQRPTLRIETQCGDTADVADWRFMPVLRPPIIIYIRGLM